MMKYFFFVDGAGWSAARRHIGDLLQSNGFLDIPGKSGCPIVATASKWGLKMCDKTNPLNHCLTQEIFRKYDQMILLSLIRKLMFCTAHTKNLLGKNFQDSKTWTTL